MRWADQIFSTINSIHAAPHTTRTGTRGELSLAEYFQIEVPNTSKYPQNWGQQHKEEKPYEIYILIREVKTLHPF